ncbi:MAG: EF-hand domain-containing protein [Gammaproteobacteria bacterium]|nr:EF-hand domain-containing protein [Gammaproteobacteria bacterium]
MNTRTLIFTLISGLFFSVVSHADNGAMTFEEMDADANNYITQGEARKDIKSNFSQIDTDADGKLTITEFQKYIGRHRMTPPEEMETPEPGAAPY